MKIEPKCVKVHNNASSSTLIAHCRIDALRELKAKLHGKK